jgi:hypothetical protein
VVEGSHDDLVFAVAIAAWQGAYQRDFVWFMGGLGGDDDYELLCGGRRGVAW